MTETIAISTGGLIVLVIAMIWTLVWTAIALWKSARNKQTVWFIVMLLVNTLGLIEVIYLAFFQKNRNVAMPVVIEELPTKKAAKKTSKKKLRKKKK